MRQIFGTQLPDTVLGWIGAFGLILGVLLTVAEAVSRFVELVEGSKRLRKLLPAFALPVGWLLWSTALVYGERASIATVLILMVGWLIMFAAVQLLRRRDGS